MVKGTRRQIIFLPNLQGSGSGSFECAYFVLRADCCGDGAGENEMLLEAEKIVAEAERLRGRSALPAERSARAADKERSSGRRRGRVLAFILGMSAGIAAALLVYFLWHMLCA